MFSDWPLWFGYLEWYPVVWVFGLTPIVWVFGMTPIVWVLEYPPCSLGVWNDAPSLYSVYFEYQFISFHAFLHPCFGVVSDHVLHSWDISAACPQAGIYLHQMYQAGQTIVQGCDSLPHTQCLLHHPLLICWWWLAQAILINCRLVQKILLLGISSV